MPPTVPFPPLPAWLLVAPEDRPVALRLFGSKFGDLDIEFGTLERARLVTRVLLACSQTRDGVAPPERMIWELPIGTRLEAVLWLAANDSGPPLEWRVRCAFPECGAEGELALHASELATLARDAYREELVPVDFAGRSARLRRPTGIDQCRWLESGCRDASELSAPLLVDSQFEDLADEAGLGDAIDRAMAEYDPLVGFRVEVRCHVCGRVTEHAVDLLLAALERLWRRQFTLLDEIHCLASHYHWTEDEIAQVPEWRRQAYLARIEGGLA